MTLSDVRLADLPSAAREIIRIGEGFKLWAFYGEIGAGKTTLIREICKALGVTGDSTSPTYSLVNEYRTVSGSTVYHFDFYRINTLVEAYDIGYEDYFYSGNLCLIEWPQNIAPLLEGESVLRISIEKQGEARTISIGQ